MTAELIDFTKPQAYVACVTQRVKGGSVLDLGAGWGRNARYFADRGFDVTAVDNSLQALERLKSYRDPTGQKLKAIYADIRTFTSSETYDVVLCTMVLHFLSSHAEVVDAVSRIQAMTKLGGLNVVSMYSDRNHHGVRPYLAMRGELADYYADWKVIDSYEGLGRGFVPQRSGPPLRHYASRITAKRTASSEVSPRDRVPVVRSIAATRTQRKAI